MKPSFHVAGLGPRDAVRGDAAVSRRIDYYDDPAAPKANSLVPSVNVVVVNEAGNVLMIRRSDNDNWAVPGGAIDLGESMVQAAVRETREETGVDCEITGLVGIYTDPKHVILYTSNGEVRQEFSILLPASRPAGVPRRAASRAKCGGCRGRTSRSIGWTGRCGCGSSITWQGAATRRTSVEAASAVTRSLRSFPIVPQSSSAAAASTCVSRNQVAGVRRPYMASPRWTRRRHPFPPVLLPTRRRQARSWRRLRPHIGHAVRADPAKYADRELCVAVAEVGVGRPVGRVVQW